MGLHEIEFAVVCRDEAGEWIHPELADLFDGRDRVTFEEMLEWEDELGIVTREVEPEPGEPFYEQYWGADRGLGGNLSDWELTPPPGRGWFLLAICDTEDGPIQRWGRRHPGLLTLLVDWLSSLLPRREVERDYPQNYPD